MIILQSEIWLVDLNPTMGSEIGKQRPCIVVSDDTVGKLPSKIVVPVTGYNSKYKDIPWMIKIETDSKNNLIKASVADTYQIRNLSKKRFIKRIGKIDKSLLLSIHKAVAKTMSIKYNIL